MPIESKTRKLIDQIQFVMLDMPVNVVVSRYIARNLSKYGKYNYLRQRLCRKLKSK